MKRYLCILLFGAILCTICSNVKVKANEKKALSTSVPGGQIITDGNVMIEFILYVGPNYTGNGSDITLRRRYSVSNGTIYTPALSFYRIPNTDFVTARLAQYSPDENNPLYDFDSGISFIIETNTSTKNIIESFGDNLSGILIKDTTITQEDWDNTLTLYPENNRIGPYFIEIKPWDTPTNYILDLPKVGTPWNQYKRLKYIDPYTNGDTNTSGSSIVEVQPLDSNRTGIIDQIGSIFGSYTPYSHGVDFQVVFGYGLILLLVYFCGRMIITLLNK